MPKLKKTIPKMNLRTTKITTYYHLKSFSIIGKAKLDVITKLEELTNIKIRNIPIDEKVLSLFQNTKALETTSAKTFRNTGALALGIFDTEFYDILLSKLQPSSLEELKNILKIDFKNYYKYANIIDFFLNEEIKYHDITEKRLWDEVLYAYYLGYYKYYYPLEFYKVLFDNVHYYLNLKIIKQGFKKVKSRILELNDVAIENDIIPRKKTIKEIAEEKGLELILEIFARNINIIVEEKKIKQDYQVQINKSEKAIIIIGNIGDEDYV